ncbi:hypothetical protein UlMin_043166 [Ulmus minor]
MSSISIPLILLLSLSLINPVLSGPRATQAAFICSNNTASLQERTTFVSNYLATMDIVTRLVARQRYASVVNGTGNTTVFAFGECMKDLSQQDCNLCIAQCKTQIIRCLPFQRGTRGGRLFYDGCYLRYDDHNFFNQSLSNQDTTVCGNGSFGGNLTVFRDNIVELVRNLSVQAIKNDGFFVDSLNRGNITVFGLAQCWEFVTGTACEDCLADSIKKIGSCAPNVEGRVLNAGCYMRYSTQKFYDNSTSDPGQGDKGNNHLAIIFAVTSAVSAVLLAVAAVVLFARKRILKKSRVLPDGKAVAIKRLFFNTTQWVDHFFNEVNLISEIRHKNLVELLGCSITGPESLLVYEYVPNQSLLDHFFGVRRTEQPVSWELRYKIILGTAEGLAYLHEESNMRIIHRDIKLSNVLLEEDFTPKIADFGLARLFPEDKTHISTAIAGTLGYMAPEYIVRGKLTEKADVYSFGVLFIEVICGRKNNSCSQDSFSILEMVWNHYGSGRICDAVDPRLEGNFQLEEASRLFQIGLLCVQASAELRPAMSMVVKMLTDNHQIIPQPTQPPFLNTSIEIKRGTSSTEYNSQQGSNTQSSGNTMTESWIEPR